jgi:LysM repeat protein
MSRSLALAVVAALILSACGLRAAPTSTPAATSAPEKNERSATVSDLVGAVDGKPSASEPFGPVAVGFILSVGGQVQTGDASKARLDLNDGSIVRMAANSSFTLQEVELQSDNSVLARVQLEFGKLWVSLFGGELQVETPAGVATVRGSFAVFSYSPGDPNNPDDDVLVLDCLEGVCTAQNQVILAQLGNLERIVLGPQNSLRQRLTDADVQLFLQENPESARLSATLTALPPSPTPTATPTFTLTPTPVCPPPEFFDPLINACRQPEIFTLTPTSTATRTRTPAPATIFPAIGTHRVLEGETLFCIGRGYGVVPESIATANNLNLNARLLPGQVLRIPAVRWFNITPGPVCATQFQSPYPGLSTPTPTSTTTLTPVPTNTPVPVQPTADVTGPSITSLNVTPSFVSFGSCNVVFSANISDPAGVTSASVNWSTMTIFGSPISSGAVPMSLASGVTWQASWTATFSGQYYGTVNWGVSALDGLRNQSSVASPTVITSTISIPGC